MGFNDTKRRKDMMTTCERVSMGYTLPNVNQADNRVLKISK